MMAARWFRIGLFVACVTSTHWAVAATDGAKCERDADCVPATCCHATACTHSSSAPKCDGVLCTADCQPRTIDCGGGCYCKHGVCDARLNDIEPEAPASDSGKK